MKNQPSPASCVSVERKGRNQQALENFQHLPDDAVVRLPVVCSLFGIGPATVWRWTKSGNLPPARRLSSKATGWRVGDLRKRLQAA